MTFKDFATLLFGQMRTNDHEVTARVIYLSQINIEATTIYLFTFCQLRKGLFLGIIWILESQNSFRKRTRAGSFQKFVTQ